MAYGAAAEKHCHVGLSFRGNMTETPYVYVFIRKDIPLADQLVQVGHVCLLAGKVFGHPDNTHVILLQLNDQAHLVNTFWELEVLSKIKCVNFYEPDDEMGFTAISTQPIYGKDREKLKEYHLWTP